jgi:hypothetical protein
MPDEPATIVLLLRSDLATASRATWEPHPDDTAAMNAVAAVDPVMAQETLGSGRLRGGEVMLSR